MTHRKAWFAGSVVAALVAALLLFHLIQTATREGATATVAAKPPKAGGRQAPGADGKAVPRLDGNYFTLDAVTRASQLASPEARRLLPEGDRLEMLLLAQLTCNAADIQRRWGSSRKLSDGQRRSWEFRMAFAKQFCDPAMAHYTDIAERFAALDVHDDTAVALGLRLLDGDDIDAVGVPTATALIRDSRSVSAMKRASDFLLMSGRDLPQTRSLPFPPTMADDSQARLDAQRMAVDRVACGMRGGCGPRGLQTMAWCGPCGPSVTLEQVWKQKYPPEVVAYSRALAAAITADRQAAGAP